jgi:tetratricopeptide (TPR) repeat protein
VKSRWLALGLALAACLAPGHGQDKMPVPVEDDPNAPPELRGQKSNQSAPPPVQPAPPPEAGATGTPYSQAMAAYKEGEYIKAFDAIKGVDPSTQDDNFVILESHILGELKRYDDGEKLLRDRIAKETPTDKAQQGLIAPQNMLLIVALGDLLLHKRSYERATKYYNAALQAKPNDPDLKLKLVYARIGSNDFRTAEQLASQLNPFDPKDPYDDHASYYFAHAALAQAQGRAQDAEDDIQNARTNYGITVTNRYLKTYLEFFSAPEKGAPTDMTPAPAKP